MDRLLQRPRAGQGWRPEEDARLREFAVTEQNRAKIAKEMGRSIAAIDRRMAILGLLKSRPGSRKNKD